MLFLQLLTGFLVLLVIFVHQSTVYEYARRKGYEGIKPGLIGLIPIYGLIHYQKAQKKRNVSDSGLKEVFKLNHMFPSLSYEKGLSQTSLFHNNVFLLVC